MKKVAVLQSNYIPWKGYFDLIAAVDEFIIFGLILLMVLVGEKKIDLMLRPLDSRQNKNFSNTGQKKSVEHVMSF